MKKIIILIALAGFTATGSYAQNKACASGHKTVTAKKAVHKVITPRVPTKEPDPTCFTFRKENLGIPGCVNVAYGSSAYTGYYSKQAGTGDKPVKRTWVKVNDIVVTQDEPKPAPVFAKVETEPVLPCYTYHHKDIVVKQCPSDFYDNSKEPLNAARVEYRSDKSYMGYYPEYSKKDETNMENKEIDGLHLPDQNLHAWDR